MPDEFFFTKAVVDEESRVYALSESSIWVFEKEGILAGRVEMPDKDIRDVVSGTNGSVYVTYNLKGKYDIYLAKVDYESGKLCDPSVIPGMGNLYAGNEEKIITYDARYLYEIDGTTGEYMAILDLLGHYIKANGICGFSMQGPWKI